MTPIHTKNNYIKITLKKYTYKSENILMISFYTKNNHKPIFLLETTFKSNNSHNSH